MPVPLIVPEETPLTVPYWEGARQGELRLQRCERCDLVLHPPQPLCPHCRSAARLRWVGASGRGSVYAVTVVEHAAHPAVAEWLPYTVLLVRLDEGPLLITAPAPESDASAVAVGTRVHVTFGGVPGTDAVLPYVLASEPEALA